MDKKQKIVEAISFLERNGYSVSFDYSLYMNKWIAFTQEGMKPVLHGKVYRSLRLGVAVKCKNGCHRFVNVRDVIKICDTKKECYMVRNKYNDMRNI